MYKTKLISYDLSQGTLGNWIVHFVKDGIPKVSFSSSSRESFIHVTLVKSRGYLYSVLGDGGIILHKTFDSWEKVAHIGNETTLVIPYLA